MKKIILLAFTLTLGVFGQMKAQSIAEQNLNYAIQSNENILEEITIARKAVNQLAKQLTVLGNPNATLFSDKMSYYTTSVLNNSDDVQYFIGLAQNNSTIPFSATSVINNANELVNQNDILMDLTNQITTAIEANNTNDAINLIRPIRSVLTQQYNITTNSITTIETIISTIRTYTVCIKTVDYQGNPFNYTAGFYAQNTTTGEYIYPGNPEDQDYGRGNCFYNLTPGTYTFGSYLDYFCGTNSATITLSEEPINSDGVIEVTLIVWCE